MRNNLISLSAVLLVAFPGWSLTIKAKSCSQADVQAAIDSAKDGDVIRIPAGTATWTKSVNVGTQTGWTPPAFSTKAITLEGAGMDSTFIIDSIPTPLATGNPRGTLLNIATKEGGLTRVTGMTLNSSIYRDLDPGVYNPAMIGIGGYSHAWRIDHVHFIVAVGHGIGVSGSTYGVIDHNTFDLFGWHFGMYIFHPNWGGEDNGDGSWTDSLYAGREKAVFIEDNIFNASPYSSAIDGWSGGRAVFRHNTLHNAAINNHGLDSPGRLRSMRSTEIYENTVTLNDSAQYYYVGQLRGGTFIVFNNTITSLFPGSFIIEDYRDYDTFDPWGKCDGTSPFDSNDNVTYDSGSTTGSAGSKVMVCAGRRWTANRWQGYHLHNLTKGQSDLIISNTADTIRTSGLTWHAPVLTWNNGDAFKILRASVCMDQRGRGMGDRVSGWDPVPKAWPRQVLEPTYAWNNTVNGSVNLGKISATNPWRTKEGREFHNIPMPGYAPYTYPHPLVTGSGPAVEHAALGAKAPYASVRILETAAGRILFGVSFRNPTPYRLAVFDVLGRRLWETGADAGQRCVTWRFTENKLPGSGVYLARLMSADLSVGMKFAIIQ